MTWCSLLKNAEPRELTSIRSRLLQESERWHWPPTLIEFQTLLREARNEWFGLPLPALAFARAKRRDWSCGAVYETVSRLGSGDFFGSAAVAAKPEKEMLARWMNAYSQVCAEVRRGATFKTPAATKSVALPERLPVTEADRKRARPGINELRKTLGLKPRITTH